METNKTAKGDVLPNCLQLTSVQLFVVLPVGGLIMLWRPPISSTTSFPVLSQPKQSAIHSRKTAFALLSRNVLFSKRPTDWSASNLPGTMKITIPKEEYLIQEIWPRACNAYICHLFWCEIPMVSQKICIVSGYNATTIPVPIVVSLQFHYNSTYHCCIIVQYLSWIQVQPHTHLLTHCCACLTVS